MTTPDYVLGSDDAEIIRLQSQAAMLAEPTALLLQRGGIRPGMRVLDLGTGLGDVAFEVAAMVGADGSVVGVEQDPALLAAAEQRRTATGVPNVVFRQGDARTFVDDELFDAVVCRLLLMHLPDAADVLAHHVLNLRPGGVIIAVDYDICGVRAHPEVELYSRVAQLVKAGFEHAQANPLLGIRLPVLFGQAGIVEVGALGLQAYWPPESRIGPAYAVGVVRALKSAIVASGIATEEELGLETLEQRLVEAVVSADAVCTPATVVGAWGRRPD